MEIMNCEWESRKNFDDKLLEIDVYKKHPSLLPFIGRHYEKIHILLVGESHYLDSDEDEIAKSIGYIIDKKNIWIWNYTKNKYLTKTEAEKITKLDDLYKEVNDIILNLPD